jgi:hypothetical protein
MWALLRIHSNRVENELICVPSQDLDHCRQSKRL